MKNFLSILLAILLMGLTTVTAFAESTNDDSNNEKTYSSLSDAKNSVLSMVNGYRMHFIYYDMMTPVQVPMWSNASYNNMEKTLDYVDESIPSCTTIDEVIELEILLNQAESNMCVDSSELQWMIDYLKKDYESIGYYDEVTTANIKKVFEQAKSDYLSNDEKLIHESYVALRNLLNELCLYNQVPGDVNNDGVLSVDDVTLMQKYLADLTDFNSSQRYLASLSIQFEGVDVVTSWQKVLCNIDDSRFNYVNKEILELRNWGKFDPNIKYGVFTLSSENVNYLYSIDSSDIWWITE